MANKKTKWCSDRLRCIRNAYKALEDGMRVAIQNLVKGPKMIDSLEQLIDCFKKLGCTGVYALPLSENDNVKQQIYFCGSYEQLSHFRLGEITAHSAGKVPNFKAKFPLKWMNEHCETDEAKGAQLILYPKYPEIRLSGFSRGCKTVPSKHLQPIPKSQRGPKGVPDGRVLFVSFSPEDDFNYAYLAVKNSKVSQEFNKDISKFALRGKQHYVPIVKDRSDEEELLSELKRIFLLGEIQSKQYKDGVICYCDGHPNCPGYTLETELKVTPNGNPTPDFAGWEVKAKSPTSRTTLLTPEPDGGYYKQHRVSGFLRKYGKVSSDGKIKFNGIHKYNEKHSGTNQTLKVRGFDFTCGKITDVNGAIFLEADDGEITAEWSFAKVLEHWQRKHHSTAFVETRKTEKNGKVYFSYGPTVTLCRDTAFAKFLTALKDQKVVYDPGPSMNSDGTNTKARSQFRLARTGLEILEALYASIQEKSVAG